MKDIHIGAHINTCSLVFTNPIVKYIRVKHPILQLKVDQSRVDARGEHRRTGSHEVRRPTLRTTLIDPLRM